jgi:hypothetical protein
MNEWCVHGTTESLAQVPLIPFLRILLYFVSHEFRIANYCSDDSLGSITVGTALTIIAKGNELNSNVSDFALALLCSATYNSASAVLDIIKNPFASGLILTEKALEETRQKAISAINILRRTHGLATDSLAGHLLLLPMLLCIPRPALLNYAHTFNTESERLDCHRQIQRWMEHNDGRTARYAVWFAGNLLRNLKGRRFFTLQEPIALLLSTITLWAYSKFCGSMVAASSNRYIRPEAENGSVRRSVIRIDQTDYETDLTSWIEGQPNIVGHLKDVGDISRPGSSSQILVIAEQLLSEFGGRGLSQGLRSWLSSVQSRT